MKLKPIAWANSLTAAAALFYIILWGLSMLAPAIFKFSINAQFLGADLAVNYNDSPLSPAILITIGVLSVSVWVLGYLWAHLYNKFSKI